MIGYFEGLKFNNFFPKFYNVKKFSKYMNSSYVELFQLLSRYIFRQHQYLHKIYDYEVPEIKYDDDIEQDN